MSHGDDGDDDGNDDNDDNDGGGWGWRQGYCGLTVAASNGDHVPACHDRMCTVCFPDSPKPKKRRVCEKPTSRLRVLSHAGGKKGCVRMREFSDFPSQ